MNKLIEDYEDKLEKVLETIETTSNTGSIKDIEKMARLNAKANEYRTFISELQMVMRQQEIAKAEEDDKIAILAGLYYKYKKTDDDKIREYLDEIKIVKMEKHAGGAITKYYPLNANSMKKIKESPRRTSLTFDAEKVSQKAVSGLEVYKTIPYLCKSTSRFFLKPDIGEIFDAIDYRDLLGNKFHAICYNTNYETLPNTDGEHHIMQVTLLVNTKIKEQREKENAIRELHNLRH